MHLPFPCLICEYEAALDQPLDRIPTSKSAEAEVEQPRLFEFPEAERPSPKDLYQTARRHGDAA